MTDKTDIAVQPVTEEQGESMLLQHLNAQHPMTAIMGRVYKRIGGEDRLVEWADDSPGAFFRLMFSTMPTVAPVHGQTGDVHFHVHQTLGPTPLDGAVDGEFKEVDDDDEA